ncbi:MAG: hydroxyacid dehydrogenase [Anaerolineae bacterium]|nr:hydroxyacid dehydrogenase [Anaerolineae bacterium]
MTATVKPLIPVFMEPCDLAEFITPALAKRAAWPFETRFVDSNQGLAALLPALEETRSPVLITGWNVFDLPDDLPARAPHLRYIASSGGSVRWMISRKILEQGILVTNWGGAIGRPVAEHCLLQILAALRQAAYHQISMHVHGAWDDRPWDPQTCTGPRSLFGRRVGIHGFGHVAQALVRLLEPFGCWISAYAPHDPPEKFAAAGVLCAATLESLFADNEIIVELAPLISETRGSVTWEVLNRLPDGGIFVNSGRGAVVDEVALVRLARERPVALALDVYSGEPLPPDSPLRGMPNVFLTPHIAGPTADRRVDCGLYALENVVAFLQGRPLKGVVDLWQFDHMT